jgi:regulator of protease activity HflC (stomatin/prohibitin superfamily)
MFEQDGFVIEEVLIRNIVMPPQITQAIEDKQAMEQASLKKGYELELTRKEAERKRLEGEGLANQQLAIAEGQAKSQIALAKGQAESKLIVANAESQALEMVAETIRKNPAAYEFKKLQVTEELYMNPNTRFVALPSEQMIYQLPQSLTQ